MLQRLIPSSIFLMLLLGVSIFASGVAEANNAPNTVGPIPAQTIHTAATLTMNLPRYFNDIDGDALTYTASSSDVHTATVSVSNKTLTVTPVTEGTATITLTGTDPGGLSASHGFTLTVKANSAPTTNGTIPDQTVKVEGTAATVDLSDYFSEPDGDTLIYTAVSSLDNTALKIVLSVSVSGDTITLTPSAEGTVTITVTATDPGALTATQQFSVTVKQKNRAPAAVGSMADRTMTGGTGEDIDVSSYFSDADADTLTYTASSSDTAKATVSVTNATVSVAAVLAGTTTITVTATDTENATATQSYTLTVQQGNNAPAPKQGITKLPAQSIKLDKTATLDLANYFTDADGDTLTYSATSADTGKATVSVSSSTLTITPVAEGTTTVTATATDPSGASGTLDCSVTVKPQNRSPAAEGSMPNLTLSIDESTSVFDLEYYFTDADGDTLSFSVSSSDTSIVSIVSVVFITDAEKTQLNINGGGIGTATITVTATDTDNATGTQSFTVTVSHLSSQADAVPGLSTQEQLLLGQLLTYDTLIFNELHNGTDDTNDWLELRNVSNVDIPIDNWQLTIQTDSGPAILPFPTGTIIAAGEVLLLTNTEIATPAVVIESFFLPQTEFALILRSPTAFGDIAGNYFQGQKERPETAPELTADTVWERLEATTSGYRAEAWAVSTHRNGLGSPGYHPSAVTGDLNNDGIVNILDLVLVASQFGTTGPSAADLNGDNIVNIQDLVLVANALGNAGAAPAAKQPTAALVNTWLQLAQQNTSDAITTSLPEGFSYARGIQMLEQLVAALTPEATALLANYPNPFNPETWIPYQLAKPADVTITIYASDGSVVRTLALGHQDAGMYHNRTQAAYWDGTNALGESVASGVYFYTLTAGPFSATRKMLIRK